MMRQEKSPILYVIRTVTQTKVWGGKVYIDDERRRRDAKARDKERQNIKLSLTCLLSTIIGVMNGSKSMRVIKVVECSSTTTTTTGARASALSRTTSVPS